MSTEDSADIAIDRNASAAAHDAIWPKSSRDGRIRRRPTILISCSHSEVEVPGIGPLPHQLVFQRYLDAVCATVECTPLLLPALDRPWELAREYARLADGALLTGDASNVDPALYGETPPSEAGCRDPRRDATIIPFVRAAIAEGVPVLGICRGLQEINVALGGTLHQRVHEVPGRSNHRAPGDRDFPDRYRPSHPLQVRKDSWLEGTLHRRGIELTSLRVNSLHGQAIDRLGRHVEVQATAPDGTIEAIRVLETATFAVGVQWHAEWYLDETPLHEAIFDEFRLACLARSSARGAGYTAVAGR